MKNKNYAFRISEKDLIQIKQNAEKAKMTVTDYITKVALGKEITVIDGLPKMIMELKKIGNNLNQLTMLCHQRIINTVHFEETEDLLGDIYIELKELVMRANNNGSA